MKQRLPDITTAFENVVNATKQALIADESVDFGSIPKALSFMHGHVKEINTILQSYSNNSMPGTYPFIALFRDVKESIFDGPSNQLGSEFKAKLGIFMLTNGSYRADDREQFVFKPILYPIFEEFIHQLTLSSEFLFPTVESMKIIKWDCYFYGSSINDKNVFNDKVDAIEIESISLKLSNTICSSNQLIST